MIVKFSDRLERGIVTIRTGPGRWDTNRLVNARWLSSLPGGMTHRSAAFFALGRGALGGLGSDGPAPFELAAVQGLELSLELLLFQLRLFALPPLLVQFLGKFLQLIFI